MFSHRVIVFCLLAVVSGPSVVANPSNRQPRNPIAVHGTIPQAKALAAKLNATFERYEPLLFKCEALKGDASRYPGKQILQANEALWQAMRDAEHLKRMGEPAGFDLREKVWPSRLYINDFAWRYGMTPEGQKLKYQAKVRLEKDRPKYQKTAERAVKLIEAGQHEAFEELMEREGAALAGILSIFAPGEQPKFEFFWDVLSQGDAIVNQARLKQYTSIAEEKIAKDLETVATLPDLADEIVSQISQSGMWTKADGETVRAPKALATLIQSWENACSALLRANALRVAFSSARQIDTGGYDRVDSDVVALMQPLNEKAMTAISRLIVVAGEQTAAEDIPVLHRELLAPLSHVLQREGVTSGHFSQSCQDALKQLLAKNPAYAAQVNAYAVATNELLRWQERFASDAARHLTKDYPASTVSMAIEIELPGNPPTKSVAAPPVLIRRSHEMVTDAAERLLMQRVSDRQVSPVTPGGRLGMVPIQDHHYCFVALPLPTESHVGHLKTLLLVNENQPALSMASTEAVSADRDQAFVSVGGVVRNVNLESLLVRIAAMPDAAGAVVPLGTIPSMGDDRRPPLQAACWRLDIQPQWAQHRYFIASVESD